MASYSVTVALVSCVMGLYPKHAMNGVIGIQGLSAIAHTTFNSSLTLLRLKVAVNKMPQNLQYTMIPENGNPDTFQIAALSSNISDGPGVWT